MKEERRSGKTNRWGVIMSITMLFTLSFVSYPLMRKYILPGIVLVIISGLMARRQIKREGWP